MVKHEKDPQKECLEESSITELCQNFVDDQKFRISLKFAEGHLVKMALGSVNMCLILYSFNHRYILEDLRKSTCAIMFCFHFRCYITVANCKKKDTNTSSKAHASGRYLCPIATFSINRLLLYSWRVSFFTNNSVYCTVDRQETTVTLIVWHST